MFRPIKNLITYIQKNASSSAIFGTTSVTTTDALVEANMEPTNIEKKQVENGKVEMEKTTIEENIITIKGSTDNDVASNSENNDSHIESYDAAVDVEMQIKSSVMFKKSTLKDSHDEPKLLKEVGIEVTGVIETSTESTKKIKNSDSHEEDTGIVALSEFQLNRTVAPSTRTVEDCCSVGSADVTTGGEETGEELNTEDEENTEERFLEFAQNIGTFPGSEIIVLNDVDLNSSVASDAPSEDPLAIDEFTQTSISCSQISVTTPTVETNSNIHGTTMTANEDGSINNEMMWINIENMKSNSVKVLSDGDLYIGMPQKRPALNAINTTVSIDSNNSNHIIQKSVSEENTEEFRSDGSDSGLGSETSNLQTLARITDTSQVSCNSLDTPIQPDMQERMATMDVLCNAFAIPNIKIDAITRNKLPLRSNLKRRLDEDDDSIITSASTSTGTMSLMQKKPKRSINFDAVQVYYFPRQQGFSCVPSAGGCTLGMAATHVSTKTLSLAEHAAELRRAHRLQLQEINPRGSSSDESEESEEDYLSDGSGSDLDAESNGFLQPVSPKQRRALLKAAGVRKIDASEKVECRDIRNSREVCGCSCRDFCDPETCACNQAGIKCQVDRAMFPCGCSRDACGNTVGRVEFNPQRVRIHFIHTIMRLEMENRQQQNPSLGGSGDNGIGAGALSYGLSNLSSVKSLANNTTGTTMQTNIAQLPGNFYGLQPQSNYSSGYASPVYATESTPAANYYQPQTSLHHYNDSVPALTELQSIHTPQSQYPIESLSSNLFSSATPAYSELMPSYGNVSTVSASSNVYQQSLCYSSNNVSSYISYQHQTSNDQVITAPPTTYSSCAVPSVPPYGSATTTVASTHFDKECNVILETTNSSSISLVDSIEEGNSNRVDSISSSVGSTSSVNMASNFIDLNTPIVNATRLSQINDLLQNNRNTTAALVAISENANCMLMACASAPLVNNSDLTVTNTAITASIDTPPLDELSQKSSLTFDELPPSLALLNENTVKTPLLSAVKCDDSKYSTDITEDTQDKAATTSPITTENATTTTSATLEITASN